MRRGLFFGLIVLGLIFARAAYQQLSIPSLQEAQRVRNQVQIAQEEGGPNPAVQEQSSETPPTTPASTPITSDPQAKILNLRIEIEDKKLEIDQKIQEMADLQQVRESLASQRSTSLENQSDAAVEAMQNTTAQERQVLSSYNSGIQQELNREAELRTQLETNISQLRSSLQTQATEIQSFRTNNPTLSQDEVEALLTNMRSRYQNDQAQLSLYQQELERLGAQTRGRIRELESSKQADLSNILLRKQAIQAELQSLNEREQRIDEAEFQSRIQGPELRFGELQEEIREDRQSLQKLEGELQQLEQSSDTTVLE